MKKLLIGLLALAFAAVGAKAEDYGIPDNIQDANILHCFNWKFSDIKAELPNIAKSGFGAVQVSPVQGSCATNAEWYYAYLPYDYCFKANGNGTKSQLQDLCTEAAKYNIKVIVDVVANHVNGSSAHRDAWWNSGNRLRYNGGINYGDRSSIINGQLGDYGDCNTASAEVYNRAKAYVEELKAIGVKGIRWDAAKHIGLPSEGDQFWKNVTSVSGMWHYGEILDGPGGDKYKLLKEYTSYIGVTDTEYSKWTRSQVCGGNVPTGHGSWTPNGVPSDKVVYWAESHDDFSNDDNGGYARGVSQAQADRAYAIGACRKGETALYFSRPTATTRQAIKMGVKGSTHFTSKEVAEVNKFRNAMAGTSDYFSQQNGIVCVTRGGNGAVIVIGKGGSANVSVPNGGALMKAGTYKDQVSGNTFTVTASTISGQVGSTGIAVVYDPKNVIDDPNHGNDPVNPEDPTTDWTVYYDNTNSQWATPYCYYWKGTENNTWPGEAMTKVTGNIYKATVSANPEGIVFNNGNQGKQTTDVTGVQNNHLYKGNGQDAKTTWTDQGQYQGGGGQDEPTPGPGPSNMPANLYVLGNIKGAHWDTENGIPMTKVGNEFIANSVTFEALGTETKAYFNLSTTLGADWDAINNGGDRYGAAEEGVELKLNGSAPMKCYVLNVDCSNCKSWTVTPGTYTLKANFSNNTVSLTNTSGIADVDTENLPAEFFTLQGIRVATPEAPGIYIRRQGNRVTKVIVK